MKKLALLALISAIALAPYGFGQASDGNVVGTVLDQTGAGVPNANVELSNDATGIKNTTKTDSSGGYRFGNLLVGTYTITVTAQGFTTASLKQVNVDLSKTTTANVSLSVGAVSSQVEVTAATALLDTTTATISNTYEAKLASELPMAANPNGGVYNLALIGAGVSSSGGVGVGYGPSVGGQRPRNNNFTIDGVDNNRKDVTGPTVFIPNDGVAEFSVLQNQFSAEFGHSSGGQFNAVLRSGTNQIHGSMYNYLQNRNLDANDQAAARTGILSPPRYDQNRLGGAAGGPIIRNKWFVFGNFEYNPIGQAGVPSSAVYEPTTAGYATLDSMAAAGTISKTNLGILKQYAPGVATQFGTKTTPVNGQNIPLGIYQITLPNFSNTYNYLITSDFTISERDQIRGRYISNRTVGLDTAASLPVFFTGRPTTAKLGSVSEFHTFKPTLSNEIRLAFNRYNDNITVPDFPYPGLDVFPNVVMRNDLNLNIGPDPNGPQATVQTTYQIVDNVSWVKGKHDFKFGFDGRDLIAASTFIQRNRGDYEWTTLSGFLGDTIPDYIAQRNVGGKPYSGNNMAYYFFANDNYRVNRNLTVNLGLRWEFNGVAQSMREFEQNSIADVPGVIVFRAPQASRKNWQPRIGFAYSPGTDGRTSIRAGFGIAYDQIFDNVGTNARPPQATSTIDVTGNPGNNFLATGGILPGATVAALTQAQARNLTSSYLPANQQLGYALTWNFGIQHSFRNDYTVEARYIGTKGVHLLYQDQINRAALVTPTFNLPTYLQAPSQATLDALKISTATFTNLRTSTTDPTYNYLLPYGFNQAITAYVPRGNSNYHGLAIDVKKRYAKNWLFDLGYTFSHLIDDSTAEVNSIVASPRRPQDFNNISGEKANSALDHRNRFTYTSVYDTPWYRDSKNWAVRNIAGNWQLAGTYTVESGEWATPQSGVDSNQNGDSAGDRVIINPNGTPGVGTDVTALKNSAGATVAYLAVNPNAQYIRAQVGAFATGGRNTILTPRINNIDFNITKNITFTERWKLQLRADMFNAVNHPQYTLGRVNNVRARNTSGSANWFIPGNPLFEQWDQSFSSNPRVLQVAAKLTF
jgi:hypothetical protein